MKNITFNSSSDFYTIRSILNGKSISWRSFTKLLSLFLICVLFFTQVQISFF